MNSDEQTSIRDEQRGGREQIVGVAFALGVGLGRFGPDVWVLVGLAVAVAIVAYGIGKHDGRVVSDHEQSRTEPNTDEQAAETRGEDA